MTDDSQKTVQAGRTSKDQVRLTLPKSHHLRSPDDFQSVYRLKVRASDQNFLVFAGPNNLPHARLGMSVAKKSHGNAVRRNRIRRMIREAFRLEQHQLPAGIDLVVVPRPLSDWRAPVLETFRESITRLARKLEKKLARSRTGQSSS